MWLHWFRLRGGQWLRGLFNLCFGWVLVMSCDIPEIVHIWMTSHFKPFQWNPGWWNVCITSNISNYLVEMNILIYSTQIWRAFWKVLATKSQTNHLGYRGEQCLGIMLTLIQRWPSGLRISMDSIVYSLYIEIKLLGYIGLIISHDKDP